MADYPFQIKMYQNRVPELIVNEVIDAYHKALPSLLPLMEKFPLVFFELQKPSVLTLETKEFFKQLEKPEKLVVIVEDYKQVEFDLDPIPVLPNVQSAFLRLKHKKGLDDMVKKLSLYPEMKSSVFEYLEIMNEGEMGFQDLVKELRRTPELGEKILKVCNSMERSINNPFPDVTRAVSFVGVEGVRQILIEGAFTNLTHLFKKQKEKLCHLRQTSTFAGMLGKLYDSSTPHTFWRMRSAGLMHDIGSLLMCHYAPNEYDQCLKLAKSKKIPVQDVEKVYFGCTHQEAGILMANTMHLPKYLYPTIARHHNIEMDKNDILLLATVIANGYVNKRVDILGYREYEDCFNLLEESKEAFDQEKKDKEFAKLLSKLPIDDIEGRKKLKKEFYNLPDEPEENSESESNSEQTENKENTGEAENKEDAEAVEEFKSTPTKDIIFSSAYVEQLFGERISNVLKSGYELKMF